MIKLVMKLRNSESNKLNSNYNGYICSSFCLVDTYEEVDFCV